MKIVWSAILRILLPSLLCIAFSQRISAQLKADFTATPAKACAPVFISFHDASTGNPSSWKWDLGNGTISLLQNPSTTYFNPGKYTIKLVIKSGNQSDSVVKINYITVYALPRPLFTASDTTGCYPLKVSFTDNSLAQEGAIVKWEWDLGDGTISSQQNPVHTYTAPGNYNIILRVTNAAGCVNTISKPQFIKIKDGVKADFSFINTNFCKPPSIVNFTNKSSGTGTIAYQWSFGDGSSDVTTNPSHTYNTAGLYNVKLTVKNNFGCTDTLEKKDSIIVGVAKSSFTSPDSVCQQADITFTNTSQPATGNQLWNFGDGTSSIATNPVKRYNAAGNYAVQLISDFGNCRDTATKTVKVLAKPTIDFTASKTAACKAPFTVQFNNTTIGGKSFVWLFGDNSSSTLPNPIHTYNQNGNYDVKLIVTNAGGCTDTLTKTQFISIQPASINITNIPVSGCTPVVFKPVYVINSVVPITGYNWDFGDGSISASPNPSHIYNATGNYTVKLTYTTADGCTETIDYPNAVRAGQKPAANFTANPTDACATTPIQFFDKSLGNITEWLWQFGDGTADTIRNPTHLYNDTGYFNIRLIAGNNGCTDTMYIPRMIHINPPIAKFSVSVTCANPYQYSFTNSSIGASSWTWDFGDGTTSTSRDPVHTYAVKGNYTVRLTVTNGGCTHTAAYSAEIVVEKANFIATSTSVCKGDSITLRPVGFDKGNIVRYDWSYQTGTSNDSAITIAYNKSGKYTVRLIITMYTGCRDTMTKTDYITVNGPTAAFSAINSSACLNLGAIINFKDSSTTDGIHAIKTWQWNFGDGNTETFTAPPFKHAYADAGIYTVSLRTTDNNGCSDSINLPNIVTIANAVATFYSPDTMSCSNKPVTFINGSTGNGLTYYWRFGDRGSSTVENPVHGYAKVGVYDVELRITDSYGCKDSLFFPEYIHIDEPKAAFTVSDSVGTCPPLMVNFGNQSQYYQKLDWDFGDGTGAQVENPIHYYNYPGTYYAKLTVTSPGGCTDVFTKTIIVKGPTGTFSYDKTNFCNPGIVSFTAKTENTKSFVWDFNDGATMKVPDSSVQHSYTAPGIYLPRMILEDAQGCKVPILGKDTIRVYGVTAYFNNNKNILCDAGMVTFGDSSISNDLITGYEWRFGDGNLSTDKDPLHTYTTTGIYAVKLIVTTLNGCTDTSGQGTNIKVAGSPQVTIRGDSGACVPATLNFFGDIDVPDTAALSWAWNFGNGTISSLQNPAAVSYQSDGLYSVQMNVTNSWGCSTSKTKAVSIHPLPKVDAGSNAGICEKKTVTLNATGADTYSWSPAATLSCSNCASPVASPANDITYRLHGETIFGCKGDDSVIIKVKHPFSILVTNGDTLCKGESYRLQAGNAELYDWTPSAGLDNSHSKTPLARPGETTLYRVVGYDSLGCFYDTGFVKVVVYPFPTVDLGEDKTIAVGSSVELNAKVSSDATFIQWQPAVGLSCANCTNPVASPKQTTSYKLTVMNAGGCINKDDVTVFVVCNNGNIFLPNTFSPNGDGNNDVFYPRGRGLYNIKSLRVFNRWGEPVFEAKEFQANDASKGWNGSYKGQPAPNDVYVYLVEVVCENNAILTYSGNIALIR